MVGQWVNICNLYISSTKKKLFPHKTSQHSPRYSMSLLSEGTRFIVITKRCSSYHVNLNAAPAAAAQSLQSCPIPCDPIDGSPPGSPVPGSLQARTLEWVAISFSNAWKWKVKVKSLSRVRLFVTPWTAAYQAPLSMGFSGQEHWSGVPLPSPVSMNNAPQFLKMLGQKEKKQTRRQ